MNYLKWEEAALPHQDGEALAEPTTLEKLFEDSRKESPLVESGATGEEALKKYREFLGRQSTAVDEFDPEAYGTPDFGDRIRLLEATLRKAIMRLAEAKLPCIDLARYSDSGLAQQVAHLETRMTRAEEIASDMLTHFRTWQEGFFKELHPADKAYFIRKIVEWKMSTPSHCAYEKRPLTAEGCTTKL